MTAGQLTDSVVPVPSSVCNLIAASFLQVSLLYPQPGWVEIDPEDLWKGFVTVVKGAVQGQTFLFYHTSIQRPQKLVGHFNYFKKYIHVIASDFTTSNLVACLQTNYVKQILHIK